MPAEWEPHAATWIAWPHNRSDWPGKFAAIPCVYAEIVRHLARTERVEILVKNAAAEKRARAVLERAHALRDTVNFHRVATNRSWTRDYGPTFLKNDTRVTTAPVAAIKWGFNAWAKYRDWQRDDAAGFKIVELAGIPAWRPESLIAGQSRRIVLEGGSIDVNGHGLLLTSEECLLSDQQQRNPGLTRANLEKVFADFLGVRKVLWLERGIVGDDTHGHIDDIARFVARDTIVAACESDQDDANCRALRGNLKRLRAARDERGHRFTVVELPMPAPVIFRGQRLPASYANFYIANRLVLVPTFNDPNDRVALNILADLFPEREVIGIYCGDLVWGLGTIHCMTQQQPA